MEDALIIVFTFVAVLIILIMSASFAYCVIRLRRARSRSSSRQRVEEASGGAPIPSPSSSGGSKEKTMKTARHAVQSLKLPPTLPPGGTRSSNNSCSSSSGKPDLPPRSKRPAVVPQTRPQPERVSYARSKMSLTQSTTTTRSVKEKSWMARMDKQRLTMKNFRLVGSHKKFTKLPATGPLVHACADVPRAKNPIAKLNTSEIKGEIMMYSQDFELPPAPQASVRRKEILTQFYHLSQPNMDSADYKAKRADSQNLPEIAPLEGTFQDKSKKIGEGTSFLDIIPPVAKMPTRRDDTSRHFILNTQYAGRLAIRFVCPSGKYSSIPAYDILEPASRTRVVIVANFDSDPTPVRDCAYYEYIQVPPDRPIDILKEFDNRPVIGKATLRLIPNLVNLSPNTFFPSSTRKMSYSSVLTNSGDSMCKFNWVEGEVTVVPQKGSIEPHTSIEVSFSLKEKVGDTPLVAELKYIMDDKPKSQVTLLARFETLEMKKLVLGNRVVTSDTADTTTATTDGGRR